jgi:hypothetical protein
MGGACNRHVTKFWYETLKEETAWKIQASIRGIICPVKN